MQPIPLKKILEAAVSALLFGFVVATFFLIFLPPAAAQSQCDYRDKILATLANKYKEAPIAVGVTNDGRLVEVLSTKDRGTWTILLTSPDGKSCLMAAGDGWRAIKNSLVNKGPGA